MIILELYLWLKTRQLMVKEIPIALAQINTFGNTTEKFLNKIREMIYLLYRLKEISKKVYNNIINSRKL